MNDASLQSLLERAVALQRGGQLAEAGHLYETVLARPGKRRRAQSARRGPAQLGDSERGRYYSLQKGPAAQQLGSVQHVVDLGPRLSDFADTAAAITRLDLVISVDTGVAHVAGALGVNVWTPLPEPADFRWLTGREHSPWYPTMRLFRQKRAGDWDDVLKRIAGELMRLSGSRSE